MRGAGRHFNLPRATAAVAVLALLAFVGCDGPSETRLTASWSAPGLQGPIRFQKVLLLVVSKDKDIRQRAEGYLSVVLPNAEGVPAYMAIPDEDIKDRAKVKRILSENGFDGAVVVRLVSASQETTWVDDSYGDFWGYYDTAWPWAYQTGYLVTETKVKLETRIYGGEGFKQLWAGMSQTFDPTTLEQFLGDLAKSIGADLKAKGLMAP